MTDPRPSRMLRLAVTPRWLVGFLVLVLAVACATLLGRWQWDRTQTILAAERAAASSPIPVEQVEADLTATEVPPEGIGRPVTATGRYEPGMQVAVVNRELAGAPGVWIVTGLRLADGRVAAVLRGWLPEADGPAAVPPTGDVTVSGVLQPDEEFYAGAQTAEGTVASIAHDRLAATWQVPVVPGFIVLSGQAPPSSPGPEPVPPTVQTADVPFPLQNFFYAFQWWIFALFAVVVYVRWLWIESADKEPAGEPA